MTAAKLLEAARAFEAAGVEFICPEPDQHCPDGGMHGLSPEDCVAKVLHMRAEDEMERLKRIPEPCPAQPEGGEA